TTALDVSIGNAAFDMIKFRTALRLILSDLFSESHFAKNNTPRSTLNIATFKIEGNRYVISIDLPREKFTNQYLMEMQDGHRNALNLPQFYAAEKILQQHFGVLNIMLTEKKLQINLVFEEMTESRGGVEEIIVENFSTQKNKEVELANKELVDAFKGSWNHYQTAVNSLLSILKYAYENINGRNDNITNIRVGIENAKSRFTTFINNINATSISNNEEFLFGFARFHKDLYRNILLWCKTDEVLMGDFSEQILDLLESSRQVFETINSIVNQAIHQNNFFNEDFNGLGYSMYNPLERFTVSHFQVEKQEVYLSSIPNVFEYTVSYKNKALNTNIRLHVYPGLKIIHIAEFGLQDEFFSDAQRFDILKGILSRPEFMQYQVLAEKEMQEHLRALDPDKRSGEVFVEQPSSTEPVSLSQLSEYLNGDKNNQPMLQLTQAQIWVLKSILKKTTLVGFLPNFIPQMEELPEWVIEAYSTLQANLDRGQSFKHAVADSFDNSKDGIEDITVLAKQWFYWDEEQGHLVIAYYDDSRQQWLSRVVSATSKNKIVFSETRLLDPQINAYISKDILVHASIAHGTKLIQSYYVLLAQYVNHLRGKKSDFWKGISLNTFDLISDNFRESTWSLSHTKYFTSEDIKKWRAILEQHVQWYRDLSEPMLEELNELVDQGNPFAASLLNQIEVSRVFYETIYRLISLQHTQETVTVGTILGLFKDYEYTRNTRPIFNVGLSPKDQEIALQGGLGAIGILLENYLNNAFQWNEVDNPANTPVEFNVRKEGDRMIFEIRDFGPGGADPVRWTNPLPGFTQRSDGTGTGVGRAVNKTITDFIGAKISVNSPNDEGTTVTVAIPFADVNRFVVLNLGDSLLKGGESQGFQTVQKGTEGEVASASDLGGISMNEDLLEMEISGEMI
ncbi:MAG: ATP-binding protein, partial [Candidatus Omnitrophica bacterium]|nr:ATP-binding protein [Candidatus Omnitrophota bacterium]